MDILLHVCCGPCAVYPVNRIRSQGHKVTGYFYNPNIHPYREFKRRISALREFSRQEQFPVEIDNDYGLTDFLQKVVFNESSRCSICYDIRLEKVAEKAAVLGAEAFSTTLLYSKYQNHELLKKKCRDLSRTHNIEFFYEDFRTGWQEGIDRSIAMDLYRQPYCGCIYSEQERYDKKLRKKYSRQAKPAAE